MGIKQIKVSLINPEEESLPYRLMGEIRRAHHHDTLDAKIALAWRIDTKPDVDGHLVLRTARHEGSSRSLAQLL